MVMLFGLSREMLELKQRFTNSEEMPEKQIKLTIEEYKTYFK